MRVRLYGGLLLVLLLTAKAAAQSQDFSYITNNGEITITGYTGPGGTVSVPSAINQLPVTGLGPDAFLSGSQMTSLSLPSTLKSIAVFEFQYCANLTSITVDAQNTTYEDVDGVLFSKNQTVILAFPPGRGGSYSIPGTVRGLGYDAFFFCANLSSVNIPNSVTNIADYTFFHCTSLAAVSIGNQVRSIGSLAFSGCTHLSSVVLPESVTNIKDGIADKGLGGAFSYCFSLTNAALGNGITNIGDLTFLDCGGLVNLTIPDSVVTMGGALFNCTGLTNVNIGSGLASPLSVVGCTSLAAINVSPANAIYSSRDGVLFNKPQTMLLVYPPAKGGNYTVTANVTNIDVNAFVFCTSLVGVYFQGNAPSVGLGSFTGDTNTIYYLPETTGWASTFGGRPALLWNPHAVVNDGNFGVRQNRFGFNIEGTPEIPLVIEAATNLAARSWVALQSSTLTNGLIYFSDAQWRNYPNRLYRIRSP